MYELHKNEQYFFDERTLSHLAEFLSEWERPCCLCAPLLGRRLAERGAGVAILDIDERFSDISGFRRYDISRPEYLDEEFGLILCDPPFFRVSLFQLFRTIRMLSRFDFNQPVLLSYLKRRSDAVTGSFAPFNIQPTGYHPGYRSVKMLEKNEIEFFGNLTAEQTEKLRAESN